MRRARHRRFLGKRRTRHPHRPSRQRRWRSEGALHRRAETVSKVRTAVLISGRGSNLKSLIEAARAPDYPAEIALVISNKEDAGGLALAREAGIATKVISHKVFGSR